MGAEVILYAAILWWLLIRVIGISFMKTKRLPLSTKVTTPCMLHEGTSHKPVAFYIEKHILTVSLSTRPCSLSR